MQYENSPAFNITIGNSFKGIVLTRFCHQKFALKCRMATFECPGTNELTVVVLNAWRAVVRVIHVAFSKKGECPLVGTTEPSKL